MGNLWNWFRFGPTSAPSGRRQATRLNVEELEERRLLAGSTAPDVTYHGGPLIQNVQIQNVYYGTSWSSDATLQQTISQTDGFLQYFVTSPYMDVLKQYNVNPGTFLKQDDVVSQNPSGQTIDDSQIRQLLNSEITAQHVATPGKNQLYIIYTAPGVTVTANGQNSNNDFAGYHDAFTDTAGATVYYAVVPYPTGSVTSVQLTPFQQETFILSHEVAESVTDPDTQTGWFDARNGEIGDLANGQYGLLNGYVVSGVWSQVAGQVVIPSATTSTTTGTTTTTTSGIQISGAPVSASAGQPFTSIVATITNVPASATLASYTATIDWGNGTTSTGTLTNDPNGGFDVTGTNTYATTGAYAVTVTVDDTSGTAVGSVLTRANVASTSATVQATGTLLSATAGQSFSGSVATFTDSSAGAALANYTATINWGDGTTSTGSITAGASGGFVVNGTHTYSAVSASEHGLLFGNAGFFGTSFTTTGNQYFVVTTTITDTPVNSSTTALALATVTPPAAVISAKSNNIAATSGQSFTGTVATFSDSVAAAAAGDFTATISWGDGTTSTGTVTAGASGFVVSGTHTYSNATDWYGFEDSFTRGNRHYVIGVSLIDTKTQDQASTDGLATVYATTPNLSVVAQNISATLGQSFSGAVATFTDTNASLGASNFTATIAWGDGTTSTGTITTGTSGGFVVSGTHTYTSASNPDSIWGGPRFDFGVGTSAFGGGALPFSVTVKSNTTSDSGVSEGQATISPAAANVQPAGTLFSAVLGKAFSGTVATFTSPLNVAGLKATIDWGDGTTSTGTIVADPKGGYDVTGTHTYGTSDDGGWGGFRSRFLSDHSAGPQPYLVTVTIQNTADNSTATAVSLASVTTPPPNLVATGLNLKVSAGTAFTGTVATFTDSDGAAASSYTATIYWGDGTRSTGTITANSGGGFLVGGTHTYTRGGTYRVSVTIRDADGDQAVSLGTATTNDTTSLGSLTSVALGILQSTEYDTDLIVSYYQQYLGRTPSSSELSWWVNAMQNGATDAQVASGFLSSHEFFSDAGNNNAAWLNSLYTRVLGRNGDTGGETYWLRLLSSGASMTDVALGFLGSLERESHLVQNYYQQYLGRASGNSEVSYWANQLASGITTDHVIASFLASPEYFQKENGNATDWLTGTYQNLLARKPDTNGMNGWLAELGN